MVLNMNIHEAKIVIFHDRKRVMCLPSLTQSTTEIEINSFSVGQKITLLYDMVMCILA